MTIIIFSFRHRQQPSCSSERSLCACMDGRTDCLAGRPGWAGLPASAQTPILFASRIRIIPTHIHIYTHIICLHRAFRRPSQPTLFFHSFSPSSGFPFLFLALTSAATHSQLYFRSVPFHSIPFLCDYGAPRSVDSAPCFSTLGYVTSLWFPGL